MELTKEQAIIEHRKMWNWIADQYEHGNTGSVVYFKTRYLEQYDDGKWTYIACNCFCCEYDNEKRAELMEYDCNCRYCPIQWVSSMSEYMCCDLFEEDDGEGLFCYISAISHQTENREGLAELARKIANLPVRE